MKINCGLLTMAREAKLERDRGGRPSPHADALLAKLEAANETLKVRRRKEVDDRIGRH
jgi:hypothetical protein